LGILRKPVVGKAAGRSMSGIHDEVEEDGKGGDLASGKWMKNLSHQKKWLKTVKKMGCP
jgi:hypothetical protein